MMQPPEEGRSQGPVELVVPQGAPLPHLRNATQVIGEAGPDLLRELVALHSATGDLSDVGPVPDEFRAGRPLDACPQVGDRGRRIRKDVKSSGATFSRP